MAIGIALILTSILLLIVYLEVRKYFIDQKLQGFELIKGVPILGAAGRLMGSSNYNFIDVISKFFKEAKSQSFRCWAGPFLVICTMDPKNIEVLMTNENCLNKPYLYEHFHCDTSIIVVDKEVWKPNRRALNSAFAITALQSYMPFLNKKSRILIERMKPQINELNDLYRTISLCMMDMSTRTLMGIEMNLQSEYGTFLQTTFKQIMNSIQYRVQRIWWHLDSIYFNLSKVGRTERRALKIGHDFIDKLYTKKVNELKLLQSQGINHLNEGSKKGVNNLLEQCLLMERNGIFSHENVLDEMMIVILAGLDTSAITVFGTLLLLSINQNHQEMVVNELHSIFETSDSDVTPSHLTDMKYTERVIKETMRLLPPGYYF